MPVLTQFHNKLEFCTKLYSPDRTTIDGIERRPRGESAGGSPRGAARGPRDAADVGSRHQDEPAHDRPALVPENREVDTRAQGSGVRRATVPGNALLAGGQDTVDHAGDAPALHVEHVELHGAL